jgi:hypothetical protein
MNALTNVSDGGGSGAEDPDASQRTRNERRDRAEGGPGGRRRAQQKIPTIDECLDALGKLAGAVALGFLSPAQANAIRGSYAEILRHHRQGRGREDGRNLADAQVLDLLRRDPTMLSALEPFLSDAQIDLVMRQDTEAGGGQA